MALFNINYTENVSGVSDSQFTALSRQLAVVTSALTAMSAVLQTIITKENKLQMTADEAVKIITDTKNLTDAQGLALAAEGDTLQKISDKFDELVANGTVPQAVADALSPLFTGVKAVSDTIDAHAALSTAILAKGVPTPPVPPVTPDPTVP